MIPTVVINPAVTKTESVTIKPESVTLNISMEAAKVLHALTGNTNAHHAPQLEGIYAALTDALGYDYPEYDGKVVDFASNEPVFLKVLP